jgi:hypothetical protein
VTVKVGTNLSVLVPAVIINRPLSLIAVTMGMGSVFNCSHGWFAVMVYSLYQFCSFPSKTSIVRRVAGESTLPSRGYNAVQLGHHSILLIAFTV